MSKKYQVKSVLQFWIILTFRILVLLLSSYWSIYKTFKKIRVFFFFFHLSVIIFFCHFKVQVSIAVSVCISLEEPGVYNLDSGKKL